MAHIQQQNIFQMQQLQQQRHRLIAPATTQSRSSNSLPYAKSSSVYAAGTTLASNNPAVVRRNARERNRVKQVNHGFLNLRQHIPTAIVADLSNGRRGIGPGANKKLSKVDTLRMAVEYIRRLQKVIDDVDNSDASSVSSFNSCGSSRNMSSSSSFGGSPPPSTSVEHNRFYYDQFNQQETQQQQQERYYGLSYAGAFANQAHNTSPVQSQRASYPSTDSFSLSPVQPAQHNQVQLKFESSYDEYTNASNDDDEELLDYISLWQEDM